MNANILNPYNSGLKLIIKHIISLICITVVKQILFIQLDVDSWKQLGNYIKTLINQYIQSPLLSNLFKIKVRDN